MVPILHGQKSDPRTPPPNAGTDPSSATRIPFSLHAVFSNFATPTTLQLYHACWKAALSKDSHLYLLLRLFLTLISSFEGNHYSYSRPTTLISRPHFCHRPYTHLSHPYPKFIGIHPTP